MFADDAYDRALRRTLWDRFWTWLGELADRLGEAAGNAPAWRWIALGLLVLLGLAVAARLVAVARASDAASARGARARRGGGTGDPWDEAQRLAAAGDHTAAAHALYRALVGALARRERLRVHASRTVGDYGRDLRARGSPMAGRYRDFARVYEVVVYGEGRCDAERWNRLLALARPMLEADAAPAARPRAGRGAAA